MRNTRYGFLVLLSLLLMLTGCSRRDISRKWGRYKAGLGWSDRSTAGGSSGDFLSEERRRQESR